MLGIHSTRLFGARVLSRAKAATFLRVSRTNLPLSSAILRPCQTRTLLTTSPRLFATKTTAGSKTPSKKTASAKTSSTKKSTTKRVKTAAKKTITKKATKKAAKKKSSRVGRKRKSAKPKTVRVRRVDKPPVKPPVDARHVFMQAYIAAQPKASNIQEGSKLFTSAMQQWPHIGIAERDEYERKAKENAEAYQKALAVWYEKTDAKVIREYNRRRVAKGQRRIKRPHDPQSPKRPVNAFSRYLVSSRDATLPPREALTKAAEHWRGMSATEKKPFLDAAEADRVRYHEEREAAK